MPEIEDIRQAVKDLSATTLYENARKENGISVEFLCRLTLLKHAIGLIASDDPFVLDARRELGQDSISRMMAEERGRSKGTT